MRERAVKELEAVRRYVESQRWRSSLDWRDPKGKVLRFPYIGEVRDYIDRRLAALREEGGR